MTILKEQTGPKDFVRAYSLTRALLETGSNRDIAKLVSRAYVMVGSRLEGVIERRRYVLKPNHRNYKCDLTEPELFQICLFNETEQAERQEEDDCIVRGLRIDPDRLALRYVKFIVSNTFDAATFNMGMAVIRQLFGLDWTSSELILSSVIPTDQGQTQGDKVLRKLVAKLKMRFDHITEIRSDKRNHQYFHPQPVTDALKRSVHRSLRLVTPWGSSHVVPKRFKRGDRLDKCRPNNAKPLSLAARISGEEQAMIHRNRRHSFIDLKCLRRLAKASGIWDLFENVCVPKFTIAKETNLPGGRSSPLRFVNEPPTEYWEDLFSEIARRGRMKARFRGDRLAIRVGGNNVGFLLENYSNLRFEITEDVNIISIVGFEGEEEVHLATLFPKSERLFDLRPGHRWFGKAIRGNARIGVRITQLGKIIDGDRALTVDVNYRRGILLPAWVAALVQSRRCVMALRTATAVLVLAISYSVYLAVVHRPHRLISTNSVADRPVDNTYTSSGKDKPESLAQDSEENHNKKDRNTKSVAHKQARNLSVRNRPVTPELNITNNNLPSRPPMAPPEPESLIDGKQRAAILEIRMSKSVLDPKKPETKLEERVLSERGGRGNAM